MPAPLPLPTPRTRNLAAVVSAEESGAERSGALPLKLTLELTVDCNLRCPHCEFTPPRVLAHRMQPRPAMELGRDDLERIAQQVFPSIQLLGPSVVGEPMMYSHWDRLLELCEAHGVFLDVFTNGTHLDLPTLERTGPSLAKLNVSMDGASPATFNKLRAPADFDDVVARLGILRDWRRGLDDDERPEVWITSVLTLQWIDELPDMVRLAAELELDGVGAGHLVALNKHWEASHPMRDPSRSDRALREAGRVARELGVSVALPRLFDGQDVSHDAAPPRPVARRVDTPPWPADGRPYYCKYMWRELFVSLDGDVSPCCGLGRPVFGNLRRDFDLGKHFDSEIAAGMRRGMMRGEPHEACRACPLLAQFGVGASYGETDFSDTYGALGGAKEAARKHRLDGATEG